MCIVVLMDTKAILLTPGLFTAIKNDIGILVHSASSFFLLSITSSWKASLLKLTMHLLPLFSTLDAETKPYWTEIILLFKNCFLYWYSMHIVRKKILQNPFDDQKNFLCFHKLPTFYFQLNFKKVILIHFV